MFIFHYVKYARIRDFSKQTGKYGKMRLSENLYYCKMFPANFSTLVCYFDYDQIMMSKIEFQIHLR